MSRRGTRREVLKALGAGAAALYFPGLPGCRPAPSPPDPALDPISPVDRSLPDSAPARYSGDDYGRAHKILWDKPGYIAAQGGLPEPAEKVPLAIVGGGISGLASAWLLRAHRPVVLERAGRFGGNSRAESWNGVDYSIGAAYLLQPDAGSALDRFFGELGLAELCRAHQGHEPVIWQGRRYGGFWDGETAPEAKAQLAALQRHFADVAQEKNGWRYPEIPATDPALRAGLDELDRITFIRHLEAVAGGALHPHVETAIEHYCWSSFGASAREIGAASGLNFLTAEIDPILVCPGGNAAIAERLLRRVGQDVPRENLRAGALVVDVRVRADGVQVSYEDSEGRFRSLLARAAVLACPKFVAAKLLHEIEDTRLAAIRRLRYHAYLVANVLLKQPVREDFYGLLLLGEGRVGEDIAAAAARQNATDAVLATYARPNAERTVLTLYRAIPHAGGRGLIFGEDSLSGVRAAFEEQARRDVLPFVGRSAEDIADIRVARWGHPLPVAAAGLIADRVPEALRAPFRERVFFVEQDNWALPAFETAVSEALAFAPAVEKVLVS